MKYLICYDISDDKCRRVVAGQHTQISTEAMYLLLQNNCQIAYIDRRGKIMAYLGDGHQSLEKLLLQQKVFANFHIVRKLINDTIGIKIANQRKLLAYYASSMNDPILWTASKTIKIYEEKLKQCSSVESARGIEGMASKIYFEAFGNIFDAKRWDWQGRNRRPPKDPINSMLSYGYAFLEREVRTGIAGTGLDPRIGFFHSNNGRKDSLVFDLMEMFRQNIIDKFVLKLINRHSFYPIDFTMD
ncbi:MAG: CRISPR-associated endonuclease Cas1 [Anaerovibrio sp.]|nr:CRISPR-associated endonuclease Cas1 [Anaerovibrio sp.]